MYHFMLGLRLPARNTAFACVTLAPLLLKNRMGWIFPWYSSVDGRFNHDFQVKVDTTAEDEYNLTNGTELKKAGKI